MDDLISRQAAIDALKGLEFCHYMEFGEYIGEDTREVRLIRAEKARDALLKLPSAQPERIRGRWIEKPRVHGVAYCSLCDYELHTNDTNFCPNCGADMRGERDQVGTSQTKRT